MILIENKEVQELPIITEFNSSTLFQEKFNQQWIKNHKLGIVLNSFKDIEMGVKELLEGKNLTQYKNNASQINNQAIFEAINIFEKIMSQKEKG